jgi:hypothetical protein
MQDHSALTTLVRAVRVLDGTDLEPTDDGIRLTGRPGDPLIGWAEIAATLSGDDPLDPAPRLRLTLLIELRRHLADLRDDALDALHGAVRPLALPVDHALHPGAGWVREPVPGGVLDLGLGVARLIPGQDCVLPLPASVAAAAGLDPADEWRRLVPLVEWIGEAVGDRTPDRRSAVARPAHRVQDPDPGFCLTGTGGCDALTLLATAPARRALLAAMPDGATAGAPSRDRVWFGTGAADPGYLRAVWTLTAASRRGVREPLALALDGVRPARSAQRSGSSSTCP